MALICLLILAQPPFHLSQRYPRSPHDHVLVLATRPRCNCVIRTASIRYPLVLHRINIDSPAYSTRSGNPARCYPGNATVWTSPSGYLTRSPRITFIFLPPLWALLCLRAAGHHMARNVYSLEYTSRLTTLIHFESYWPNHELTSTTIHKFLHKRAWLMTVSRHLSPARVPASPI